ncbi:class I SAM-dependent DNA methyltransferase [Prevotella melaninogenica]|uniref:class I SAM-dependent DNA methyltransferase n=1 Tax=Prevotella melaninogenica TaxID=28132 RepID=UPI00352D82A5
MAVNNIVKRLQNIMRQDAGINGDAQRIEQMTWMFFLKVYDTQEETWEYKASKERTTFESIIPEELRWRNWAIDEKDGDAMTGDALLSFINDKLFPTLKGLEVTRETPRSKAIVKEVFEDLNQYMKNGILLRQVINVINEIEFDDATDRHMFGDIYEGILKDLQSAGNAGEFYTPRALTDFIIQQLSPVLGETVGDFTSGTGGFLTSALNYLQKQVKTTDDGRLFQKAVIGQEWKPLPYLLSITNLLLHDVESPNIRHCDSLGTKMSDFKEEDKVNVIAMNPPYGGSTDAASKSNFPMEFRSSETADLFMVLIMYRLKANGRAAVIVPDGFLFGTDGAKLAIKQKMLRDFNLHTIIRLPGSIFAPYTSIATNILFFNNERAEGAEEGFSTHKTWFYRLDMPEGYKHFSKTKSMRLEHCQPICDWWNDRKEIASDELGEKARCFTAKEFSEMDFNFDQCKFPKDEEEILPPAELLANYFKKRKALDDEIDKTLAEIQKILGIEINIDKQL